MEKFDARKAALELVTAFVSNNKLTAAELPGFLTDVFSAVSGIGSSPVEVAEKKEAARAPKKAKEKKEKKASAPKADASSPPAKVEAAPVAAAPVPAVSVKESTRNPDFIISLITGEKLKTLKRHLKVHGLTEAAYRERYGLPADYPFVSPSYSLLRRKVAQNMGLGRRDNGAKTVVKAAARTKAAQPDTVRKVKAAKPIKAAPATGAAAPVATQADASKAKPVSAKPVAIAKAAPAKPAAAKPAPAKPVAAPAAKQPAAGGKAEVKAKAAPAKEKAKGLDGAAPGKARSVKAASAPAPKTDGAAPAPKPEGADAEKAQKRNKLTPVFG